MFSFYYPWNDYLITRNCLLDKEEDDAGAGKKTVIVLAATNTPWDLDEVN